MKTITKNIIPIVAGFLLIVTACQSPSQRGENGESGKSSAKDIMKHEVPAEKELLDFRRTKVLGQRDTISFELSEPSFVKMTLSIPDDAGNIRINQLIMPDGQMDGPFEKTYEVHLDKTGAYQVIIAESMMAENPYTGDYHLKIEVE